MKRILLSLALLISMPALVATGRHAQPMTDLKSVERTFILAAKTGNYEHVKQLIEDHKKISLSAMNKALTEAHKRNTSKTTDTDVNKYTLVIEVLLDHGAVYRS